MKNGYKIIDTHCHIYPDKIAEKASQSTSDFYHMKASRHSGRLDELLAASDEAGVDHIIVQSVATAPSQVASINRYIAGVVAESGGRLTGLGTLHPDSDDIEGDIALVHELGLKGVKMHADIQRIAINDRRCYKIYEILEGRLPILMHTGDKRYNFSNPDNLVPVMNDFPRLTVIGAHYAGWSVWEEAADKLSGYENLYVDTSSTLGFTGIDYVRKLLPRYSEDRILFGVDHPMWTPKDEVDSFFTLNLPDKLLRKIFSENASSLYGIKL